MTPELKTACELVFQEHKTSGYPINWNKHVFRKRISLGLSALAKETLEKKNIIYPPNPSRKAITALNPSAISAASFEEAEELIQNNSLSPVKPLMPRLPVYAIRSADKMSIPPVKRNHPVLKIAGNPSTATLEAKWYLKPLFYYAVWPLCAVIAGGLIAWLIGMASELF